MATQVKASLLKANALRQQQWEKLLQGLADEVQKEQLQVREFQNMLAVDLAEQVIFESGRATLLQEGRTVLFIEPPVEQPAGGHRLTAPVATEHIWRFWIWPSAKERYLR